MSNKETHSLGDILAAALAASGVKSENVNDTAQKAVEGTSAEEVIENDLIEQFSSLFGAGNFTLTRIGEDGEETVVHGEDRDKANDDSVDLSPEEAFNFLFGDGTLPGEETSDASEEAEASEGIFSFEELMDAICGISPDPEGGDGADPLETIDDLLHSSTELEDLAEETEYNAIEELIEKTTADIRAAEIHVSKVIGNIRLSALLLETLLKRRDELDAS